VDVSDMDNRMSMTSSAKQKRVRIVKGDRLRLLGARVLACPESKFVHEAQQVEVQQEEASTQPQKLYPNGPFDTLKLLNLIIHVCCMIRVHLCILCSRIKSHTFLVSFSLVAFQILLYLLV